jgi:hypothetical protein
MADFFEMPDAEEEIPTSVPQQYESYEQPGLPEPEPEDALT